MKRTLIKEMAESDFKAHSGIKKNVLVLSGINLNGGGTLNIYYDFLNALLNSRAVEKYRIIAFVSSKKLFEAYENEIFLEEISVSNHVQRLYYELIYFNRLSKKIPVDIWISVHDITPNVQAGRIYTYCQTAFPFLDWKKEFAPYANRLFINLYKHVYKINSHKATAYITQQEWMRKKLASLTKAERIIVARPVMEISGISDEKIKKRDRWTFVYPSLSRFYKNFEIACEACHLLERNGIYNFELILTLSGTEDSYSRMLKQRYGTVKSIKWTGKLSREKTFQLMQHSDCMIYTSVLESWGLPISEYKKTGKPILISNLPFAHEAVGNYERVKFLDPFDAEKIAKAMKEIMAGKFFFEHSVEKEPEAPFAKGWPELIDMILEDEENLI